MIIALEGVEATGKSTVCELLTRGLVGTPRWRIYRALRLGDKWEVGEQDQWHDAGVPANTFVEDIFAIDFVKQSGADNLIFNRSLPSGIVYDEPMWLANGALSPRAVKLIHWWAEIMQEVQGLLVYLHGDLPWIQGELEDHGRDISLETLEKRDDRFRQVFNVCEMAGLKVFRQDTSVEDFITVASRIGMKFAGGWQEPLPLGDDWRR